MCDPTFILMGQALGAGVSAYGAARTSAARRDAANYNAAVNQNLATDATTRGNQEIVRHRMRTKQLRGKQIAAMAANGVALNEGSALDILAGTDILSDIDEQTLRENAEREARGYRAKGALAGAAADSESPLLAGATPLLTGGSQVASNWYNFKATGVLR